MNSKNNEIIDFNRICRCCLTERLHMKLIFDTTSLPDMLMSCASILIKENDNLPSLICNQCIQQVNRSYTFRKQCENSDNTLREWLISARLDNDNSKKCFYYLSLILFE